MRAFLVFALCAFPLAAQNPTPQAKSPVPEPHPSPGPEPARTAATPAARMIRFDVNAIDKSVDPCSDFFQFACGNWIKSNPIPPDQAVWGRFSELEERNRNFARDS